MGARFKSASERSRSLAHSFLNLALSLTFLCTFLRPPALSLSLSFFLFSTPKQATAHPTHSACSDASKQDIASATGSPATATASAAAAAAIRGGRGSGSGTRRAGGGGASNAGSAAGSPGSAAGPSRLGGGGNRTAAAAAAAVKVIVAAAEAVGGGAGAGPSSSALPPAAAAAAGKAKKAAKVQQQQAAAAASSALVRTITPPLQALHHDPSGSLACFPTPGPPDSSGGSGRGAAAAGNANGNGNGAQTAPLAIGDDEELVGPEGMDFDPFGSEDDDEDNCTQGGGGGSSQATHGNGDGDGFINPQTGKRTRRRVTVETTDADGRPYTQAEIRRMKRRITNRESARRMRLKRQEEWSAAKTQFRALRDDRASLAARAAAAEAAAAAAADGAARWQTLWRSAAASNLALSRRVAELGGEPAPVVDAATLAALGGEAAVAAAAGGSGSAGSTAAAAAAAAAPATAAAAAAAAPPPPAAAPKQQQQKPSAAHQPPAPLFRDVSGLVSALLPTPRDSGTVNNNNNNLVHGSSRPASAGTPRDGAGRRRTTGNGALVGLAASGRAATATLPLPDSDFEGVFGM